MNTLTGIEAERVSQILRHAVDRLHILSYLPTSWDDGLANGIRCDPVLASLEKLWIAEDVLKSLGEGVTEGGKDIVAIRQAHRASKNICRNLMVERESLQILMTRPEVQSEDFLRFLKYLNELKSQTNDRMTTTVEDELINRTTLQDLVEKVRAMEESKETLEKKLQEVREDKERTTSSLDLMMRKLQLELSDITSANKVEMDAVQKEMTDALTKASADHEVRMKQLHDQVDALERQLAEVVERNRDDEIRMRKEKGRAESALNAKIAQYDEDMGARQKNLQELKSSYSVEAKEYSVLKEYFDRIDSDLNRGAQEEAILAAVARRRAFGEAVLDRAAAKIQKIARGRIARAAVAKMKAKSKKGGKKGGKKKK